MKNVMSWLQGTEQIEVENKVVKAVGRELTASELGLVAGAMRATSVILTRTNSGGSADDSMDGGGDSIDG